MNFIRNIKISILKSILNLAPFEPDFDKNILRNETFRHPRYLDLSSNDKDIFLNSMSQKHYDLSDNNMSRLFKRYNFKRDFEGKKILDIGCFVGGFSVRNAEEWGVSEMYGIDPSKSSIYASKLFSEGRKNTNTYYSFEVADSKDLPYEESKFDGIVCIDVLNHVSKPEKLISEAYRVLKPGGKLFISVTPYYSVSNVLPVAFVSKMPFLTLFFSFKNLVLTHSSIISKRGEKASWYSSRGSTSHDINVGIGSNVVTIDSLKKILSDRNFKAYLLRTPLFSASKRKIGLNLNMISKCINPLLGTNTFANFLSQKFVLLIVKK